MISHWWSSLSYGINHMSIMLLALFAGRTSTLPITSSSSVQTKGFSGFNLRAMPTQNRAFYWRIIISPAKEISLDHTQRQKDQLRFHRCPLCAGLHPLTSQPLTQVH